MGHQGQRQRVAATRLESVKGLYSSFNDGDIEAVIALMSPDVDWTNPMEGGRGHGHAAVRRTWERLSQQFACKVSPRKVDFDMRGRVVVDAAVAIRDATGKPLAHQRSRHIFSFHGDLIQRLDIHEPPPSRH